MTNQTSSTNSVDTLSINSYQITLKIIYESGEIETSIKCNLNDKVENILIKKFAEKNNIDYSSFNVLYSGKILTKDLLKEIFSEIIQETDKNDRSLIFLIYKKEDYFIKVNLIINSSAPIKLFGYRKETLKDILTKNQGKIEVNINSMIFEYKKKIIDLEKKLDDIVDESDEKISEITIYVNSKKKKSKKEKHEKKEIKEKSKIQGDTERIKLSTNPIKKKHDDIPCQEKYKNLIRISIIIFILLIIIILGIIIYYKFIKNEGKKCNEGYYLPDDDNKCKKCLVKGCKKCKGTKNNNECIECDDNLRSIKQNGKIMECLNNKTCKEGYYLPYDALTYEDCQKCSIEGCIEC